MLYLAGSSLPVSRPAGDQPGRACSSLSKRPLVSMNGDQETHTLRTYLSWLLGEGGSYPTREGEPTLDAGDFEEVSRLTPSNGKIGPVPAPAEEACSGSPHCLENNRSGLGSHGSFRPSGPLPSRLPTHPGEVEDDVVHWASPVERLCRKKPASLT